MKKAIKSRQMIIGFDHSEESALSSVFQSMKSIKDHLRTIRGCDHGFRSDAKVWQTGV